MILSENELKLLVQEIANLHNCTCESCVKRQETATKHRLKEMGIEEQSMSVKEVISSLENMSRWSKSEKGTAPFSVEDFSKSIDHAIYYLSKML